MKDPHFKLCVGKECPIRDNCLRRMALAEHHAQSYFDPIPYDFEKKECEYFIELPVNPG